jgi:UDP:flavonoid glycosyltransferase YjiC (YdhE family)
MKITFATVGSRGDVQPMVALALEARRRGHEPLLCAPPNFAEWSARHQLPFCPLGMDIQVWLGKNARYLSSNPITMLQGMNRFFADELPGQFPQLATAARGTDALVIAGLAFSGPSVAELLDIPLLAVAYSTCVMPSSQHPPPMVPWQGLPTWINDLLWRANRLASDALIGDAVNRGRRLLGQVPTDFGRQFLERLPFVLAVDEVLFPPDPAWADRCTCANFLFYDDDPTPLDPELDAWLANGEPPIFVGFGSMSGNGISRIDTLLTEALSGLRRRCLIGAGWGDLGDGDLPAGWRRVSEAPHALLFPRTAVVVHHGGSGTTANALRAGTPQVILPLILDQFHHGHRLHKAGLAPKPVPMESATAGQITDAIRAALAMPQELLRAVAQRLHESRGAEQILKRLEAMVVAI